MEKSCIIFACTILSEDRLFVLKEFLDEFRKDFYDSDIYVGINPESVKSVEDLFIESKLNIVAMERAPSSLYDFSDASAYQMALKLAKSVGKSYENYWFIHTKGAVNPYSNYLRKWYIDNLMQDRAYIEGFMSKHTDIGSYGLLGLEYDANRSYSETDVEVSLFEDNITESLPYTHAKFFYIHSLYVIKGNIIDSFFSLITDKWFDSKLNKYYFEGIFPFIVSRLGYFPYLSNRISMNGADLMSYQDSWIYENNLISYEKYKEIYRTNYNFDQLKPPYVNSNT